jgi:molecular chaperone IbpA
MQIIRPLDAAALAQLNRALIGFDRIFHNIEARGVSTQNYPPYNVLKYDDNNYEIEVAVAGFGREDITVEVDQDQLIIRGHQSKDVDSNLYIHRGLAARDFERAFTLPQYMEVGEVSLTNGILHVKLAHIVPEALQPRRIEVK